MALDHLIATLRSKAEAEADRILSVAKSEAATMIAAVEERNALRRREATRSRESRLESEVERGLLEARGVARNEQLEARHRLVSRVLDVARPRLEKALSSVAYRNRLEPWARQAFDCVGQRQARVHCHPSLVPELKRLAASYPGLTVIPDPACGTGFRLVTEDDAMEVDCTLEGRLAAKRPVLSIEVLEKFERDR